MVLGQEHSCSKALRNNSRKHSLLHSLLFTLHLNVASSSNSCCTNSSSRSGSLHNRLVQSTRR